MNKTLTKTTELSRSLEGPRRYPTSGRLQLPIPGSKYPRAFNSDAIVYDNTPWRPGRVLEPAVKSGVEDERKLKNVATRIMSNGVEVLVKDKSGDGKPEQRKLKVMHLPPLKSSSSSSPTRSLLSSAVATVVSRQQISALFPLHQLMQHNYIIKTCMTTYTYLTTVVQNKRSAISTFETIVSVVTTESITNYPDVLAELKPTKTKYMEVKTIQPSAPTNMYVSNFAKIDKRIDSDEDGNNFELIQPSEVNTVPCSGYSCSHSKTESLNTKYTNIDVSATNTKYGIKSSQIKLELLPTNHGDKKTQFGPYKFESSTHLAPIDKMVEKYTEVNDVSEEKESSSVEESELLTNEQAPTATKIKSKIDKVQEKKPEKPQKINKSKFAVADLLKLGSLGIKGLTQLAPVIEKMTGCFTKKQEQIAAEAKTTPTTIRPAEDLVAYSSNKRIDNILESKQGTFPIYIPVDELETSESQSIFTNATLHQNLVWAAEHKHSKLNVHPHKIIHESPLVNGGIPISPGEIITANSDVIVGKPAVGGPLTLAASGMKLHNPVQPPPLDSFVSANEQYSVNERPLNEQSYSDVKVDDSYDLRPPGLPKPKPNRSVYNQHPTNIDNFSKYPYRMPNAPNDDEPKKPVKNSNHGPVSHHGRPMFLDYIPSLASFNKNNAPTKHHVDFKPAKDNQKEAEILDNSPSSSEIVSTHIRTDEEYTITGDSDSNKPFLVDIQPSRVANVLIPHGSSTALVFAGSSEPHKTGDYVDDPLPYPEPGYFGSFSIDAPQMTNVHNVAPNTKPYSNKPHIQSPLEPYKSNSPVYNKDHQYKNDQKLKWKDYKRPIDFNKLPPPTSNQETHVQVGPQITQYNPDIYDPSNGDFEKYNQVKSNEKNKGKEVIDKDYENYLAVPPPPPKNIFNQENKNKPYNQRPIIQTKPVQDMSVFLNIQHPVPKEPLPPKVTSEIYFAAQAPHNKQSPTYTIHMPLAPTYSFNKQHNLQPPKTIHTSSSHVQNSHSILPPHNSSNKTIIAQDNNKESTYTVTLNTATNVGSHVKNPGQVIGSSVPVAINNGQMNADIPIGTNFAIKVEDNTTPLETYNLQGEINPQIIYDNYGRVPLEVSVGDNRWNKSTFESNQNTIIGHNYQDRPVHINEINPSVSTIYEDTIIGQSYSNRPEENNIRPSVAAPVHENTVMGSNFGERPSRGNTLKAPTNQGSGQTGFKHEKYPASEYAVRPSLSLDKDEKEIELNYGEISAQANSGRPLNHQGNQGYATTGIEFDKRPAEYAPRPSSPTHYESPNIVQSYSDRPSPINPVRPTKPTNIYDSYSVRPTSPAPTNSHANFPMTNEDSIGSHTNDDIKPVVDKVNDSKRPGKLIPNVPTNSHGWYSSVIKENNIKNIEIGPESTTRKVIPLLHDVDGKNNPPSFGQKITSAGQPPSEFWAQNKPQIMSSFNIGRPFTKQAPKATEKPAIIKPFTFKPYKHNYIPNLDTVNQPAYDIPIRDNSDETTTHKTIKPSTEKTKLVYENSEEVYDGEEEFENPGEIDGEISSESMKIPVLSASNEVEKSKSSTELILLQDEVLTLASSPKPQVETQKPPVNSDLQTEKPFGSYNKSNTFQSNSMKPIYDSNLYMKPRPFTVASATVLDHQLQQPHWQINQLMENATNNVSYEDNLALNIGEEMNSSITPPSIQKPYKAHTTEYGPKYNNLPRPVYTSHRNISYADDSSIITSTVHIKDKKPLIVEKLPEKTTLPSFTIASDTEINRTSSEIIDLSPPPPTIGYKYKPSSNDEMIMGMSPPPARNPPNMRQPPRNPLTPRPSIPMRTPVPHVNKPPRTLPPRPHPQRPTRKPINRDEVSTYRPAYDIHNNIRRPAYNRDQPSSQLLPPPREILSRPASPIDMPSATVSAPPASNIVFPTPISSGWLTSSGVGFSSSFNFGQTTNPYPETTKPPRVSESSLTPTFDNSFSYENEYSSEHVDASSEKTLDDDIILNSNESSTESDTQLSSSSSERDVNDSHADESGQEETTDKIKVGPVRNKNRTRKPYPFRNDGLKTGTSKFKLPPKPTAILRPTRTRTRPEILYPTRQTSIRNIVRPTPSRLSPILATSTSIIESSEPTIDEDFMKPTEVLKNNLMPTMSYHDETKPTQNGSAGIATPSLEDINSLLQPTHHAGNEVKISDEIIPTKTEFKTTIITHTKTLSEPPMIISSVGYVNLTHTLTVTHTETSLVSQSEGAVTQTYILTNTHTSTVIDVITEIHTQVQPTTIIETVTKHIPVQVQHTPVQDVPKNTKTSLDDVTMSSEEDENLIIRDSDTTESVQKIDTEADGDNDTFFVVMNKSQNGGQVPPISTDIDTGDYEVTRNEQVNNNGVSQVLFGEILLAGTPYLETNVHSSGFGKECQPECKASRNERCQRIDSIMKCVCRPGFARMFPDRPCKPTYTYSVKLALGSQGNERLLFDDSLADNSTKYYQSLAFATHEGINRMIMQSDLRDVYHGVHITGFKPVQMKDASGDDYRGVMNDFYVQLSDNAHESRLKEVIEKYLRNSNYSLGGTDVHAAGELVDKLDVSDFDECTNSQFHDCSEHAQCFNLRGTYTCSCLEGFADLSVNNLYPGRICSAEPVGCEKCNYHGSCYSRDDARVLCECFQWYAGSSCQVNLKVVLISLVVLGALLTVVLAVCAVVACSKKRPRPPKRSIVTCIQSMPSLHQGAIPSKQRQDRRALINERGDSGDASSIQNASLPYMPSKRPSASSKKCIISAPPAHDPPPPPAPAVMIPRARLHERERDNLTRKRSAEISEAKLISYLESGVTSGNEEMRRKHSLESSYSANKERHHKQGALVSAGYKVSTTIRPDEAAMKEERDDLSSVNKADLEDMGRFDSLRKSYSQEDLSEWTDAERRGGELTLSEARSVGGTLPASTGRAASSTRLTHQEANTMAERDLGSTFLLPHVHLYKPDLTSDVSEFDSL